MFACLHKDFILKIISISKRLSQLGKIIKSKFVLPLKMFHSFHNPSVKYSCSHDLDKLNELWLCLVPYRVFQFINIWVWWVEFWIAFDNVSIKLGFNSPSKCLCLVYNFEVLKLDVSMSFFLFLFISFLEMKSHFPLAFLVDVG